MLKLDLAAKSLKRLDSLLLAEAGLKEREDLQEWILNSPDAFFEEIDEDLLILQHEGTPSADVADRFDLLALDNCGNPVVIELKRGNNKWQLSQGLCYAAMVAQWGTGEGFLQHLDKAAADKVKEFLDKDTDITELNKSQRVLLVAEAFDREVIITSQWLIDKCKLDIRCYTISLAHESAGGAHYLSCTRILPAVDPLESATLRRGAGQGKPKSWEEILSHCKNDAVLKFFKDRVHKKPRMNKNANALAYPQTGTIRWYVEARRKAAWVFQRGRFQNDEKYWSGLSDPKIKKWINGTCLRFYVQSEEDFAFFGDTMNKSPADFKWLASYEENVETVDSSDTI